MKKLFLAALCLPITTIYGQNWFAPAQIESHIRVLAADSMQGRATGSEGERMAADYILRQFSKAGLKPAGDKGTWLQEFSFGTGTTHDKGRKGTANNVIAWLDNQAKLTLVIGAHYDHLGDGSDGHSLAPNEKGEIHNGADDNASGVAGLIELARYYAGNGEREKFNFVFVAFSGEEMGLLGSDWFINHTPIPLEEISGMLNMDMIGRLDPKKPVLTVSGTGTAPEWENLLKPFSSAVMQIQTDSAGLGPSDHASFYKKGIPALHFFTGSHSDYHKPSDDIQKINFQGIEAVLMVMVGLVDRLPANKLTFLKTRNNASGTRASFKVSLGIMPSYAVSESGLKAESVIEGKPGAKAGMKDGDIVIRIGDHPVKDIQSYMDALGKFEKGQKADLEVIREGVKHVLRVEF